MRFATYWTRGSIRQSWRSLAGIALLVALIGGLALFAIAGARRTQSAYPRFVRSTNPSTMAIDVGGDDVSEVLRAIPALPEVEQAKAYQAFYVAPWVDGDLDLSQDFEALGSLDGRFFEQDRFTPIEGRLPDPDRADEVVVNEEAARRYGYHVGQQIDLATADPADVESVAEPSEQTEIQPALLIPSTIVGVGTFIEEVMQDDTDRSALVLLTPAYVKEAAGLGTYAWQGVVLRNGDADIPAVTQTLFDEMNGVQIIRVVSTDTFHAQQAIRPVSLALAVFGVIAGAACLALSGQALARHLRDARPRHGVARALGAGTGDMVRASSLAPALAVVGGSAAAIVLAVLASPLMPIGEVRRVEVSPGFDADWTVLGIGAVLLVVPLVALVAGLALRDASRPLQGRASSGRGAGRRPLLGSTRLPPTAAIGLEFAGVSAPRRSAAFGRSVMASAAIAVAALVAAVTFGASMQHLVANPALYGWDWDVAVVDGGGYGNTDPVATREVLGSDEDIEAWGGASYGAENIDGTNVALLGIDPSSAVVPPINEGRMVAGPGEIVLGPATMAELHVAIGDTVQRSNGSTATIVGSAIFPAIGQVHADHTSLGVGGIVVPSDLPGFRRNLPEEGTVDPVALQEATQAYGPNVVFVRFRDDSDRDAALARLEQEVPQIGDYNGVVVTPVQRAAEIVNADSIKGASLVLGTAIAVAALASLGVALTVAVRRRRRDLALLRTLGFTGRQLSATVGWQATITIAVALVIGVPVGAVVGRWTWSLFADQLDVVADPVVPVAAIALVAVSAFVAAILLALVPARYARTVPAALARGE